MNGVSLSVALTEAARMMREAGVRGVLVGTGALLLHGYAVEAPDLDFLVDGPVVPPACWPDGAYTSYPDTIVDGVTVQFVPTRDGGYRDYFHPERAVEIAGVPVAAVEDVIGLKR
jgi:hypothetical protein